MKIAHKSSLKTVAFAVGDALRRAGIEATLTGGSCATVHSDAKYQSMDIDFVLRSAPTQTDLDRAMSKVGFEREGARYVHSESPYFVEFPLGPLGIGDDYQIKPVELRLGSSRIQALSPTDACRDRLAAFYHWNDRQSLQAAVEVARRRKVNLKLIERWSRDEGAARQFKEFRRALDGSRRAGSSRPLLRSRQGRVTVTG